MVDDSKEVRALVRRRLQSSGMFEVVGEGGDGEDAISLVHRHEPTLMLLDTSMPTMDGIEALPAILALCPETRVVMFTGFEEHGLAARARELGAADFIEKSIPLEELPGRLMRTLNQASPGSSPRGRHRLSVVSDVAGDEQGPFAQEQLVLNEHIEQFRELFDQAAIGMATLTVNGTIVRANRALAELMSCSTYDLVGVDYGRLTNGGGERLDRGLEAIRSVGEDLTTFEHHLPTRPGTAPSRVVRVMLAPIRDSQQQVLYVFAQVQDISAQLEAEADLRRSEETFRLMVTAVGEYAIFMLDVEGNVISWNAGAQRIKGYAASEIIGRSFRVFYPSEEQATGHPEHNLEVALRKGSFAEAGWRVRQDGSRFWASVVISPVYDDAGRHVGFAKVTRDQTRVREHEEERKKCDRSAGPPTGRDRPRASHPHSCHRRHGRRSASVVGRDAGRRARRDVGWPAKQRAPTAPSRDRSRHGLPLARRDASGPARRRVARRVPAQCGGTHAGRSARCRDRGRHPGRGHRAR